MASPRKADVLAELATFNVEPPAGATVPELVRLLKRVKALRSGEVVEPPAPRRTAAFSADASGVAQASGADALTAARLPRSDHLRRPWDPVAGW